LRDYVFRRLDALLRSLSSSPTLGAGFYYVMTCQAKGQEPRPELIRCFPVHQVDLDERRQCWIVGYPIPPAVDLSRLEGDDLFATLDAVVLAPYFSAIVKDRQDGSVQYFVLGQSPDGGTTLRGVTATINANLGPGCEPNLEAFTELLRRHGP